MADRVTVFEVGPRDGLQNEKSWIPTADKIRLIDLLTEAGLPKIEAASFVSPKWIPQMADAADVMAGIKRGNGAYAALTPNLKGYENARAAGATEVAVFAAASESFSRANVNASITESLERFKSIMLEAKKDGMPVRGYVSCVAHCPYDGATAPAKVARVVEALLDMGCYEISLGETLGRATPEATEALLDEVLTVAPPDRLAGHFHDTGGRALENIEIALHRGLRTFDASVGGLGGCPYAPGAAGNVATEAVVDMLERQNFVTGVNRERLAVARQFVLKLKESERG